MLFRRSVLLVALACLLLNALECYGASLTSAQARKCCGSGHCSPANLDPCCRNSPTGTTPTLVAQPKTSVQQPIPHMVALSAMPVSLCVSPQFERIRVVPDGHPPPRDLPNSSLPLRI